MLDNVVVSCAFRVSSIFYNMLDNGGFGFYFFAMFHNMLDEVGFAFL